MRKFHVTYREYTRWGDFKFNSVVVTLNEGEKANLTTFRSKLKGTFLGGDDEIMSWSLIEE